MERRNVNRDIFLETDKGSFVPVDQYKRVANKRARRGVFVGTQEHGNLKVVLKEPMIEGHSPRRLIVRNGTGMDMVIL